MPEHPIVRTLGARVASVCYPLAAPYVFAHFARPLNELRRRHGLPTIGSLREIVTHGDYTLFADAPELVSVRQLPPHQRFIGPVHWSAPGELPEDWGRDPDRPGIYVTLGSSGDTTCLPVVLSALSGLSVDILVSTAGRVDEDRLPRNVRAAAYVPGDRASARAKLVITNGGSSTGYQALTEGTPVVGIPYNLDQYLATAAMAQTGAAIGLRSGSLTVAAVRRAAERCLRDPAIRDRARGLQSALGSYDARGSFTSFVREVAQTERLRHAS
jgi:UDP:flavonoid glycosyltransferase YjiC (YdhE family)